MSMPESVRSVLSQYATFTGRARRSEYWWWSLAQFLVVMVLYVLGLALLIPGATTTETGATELGPTGGVGIAVLAVMGLLSLALFVPSLAVQVRRLHDTGRSGWWYLISFVPGGGLVLLVFAVMDSTPGSNQHGPNPKGVGDAYGAAGYGGQAYGNQAYGTSAYGTPAYGTTGYGTPAYGDQGYGQPGTPAPYGTQPPAPYGTQPPAPSPYGTQPPAGQPYGDQPHPQPGTPPQG